MAVSDPAHLLDAGTPHRQILGVEIPQRSVYVGCCLFGFAGAVSAFAAPTGWPWFAYHPFAMLVAFFPFAGSAILFKKAGGYRATKLHGCLMGCAMSLALFGWYVIYSNKSALGKPHNTSWHATCGLLCLGMYAVMGGLGALALDPDIGQMKANQGIRMVHKRCGQIATTLGWLACLVGWYNIKGLETTLSMAVLVAAFGWYLLV